MVKLRRLRYWSQNVAKMTDKETTQDLVKQLSDGQRRSCKNNNESNLRGIHVISEWDENKIILRSIP
jgi:hypothetical protein